MVFKLIQFLGKCLSSLPNSILAAFCNLLGTITYRIPSRRKKTLLLNLHHAFPKKTEAWRKAIAKKSCQRMVQMGLFVLISPYWHKSKINKNFQLSSQTKSFLDLETQKKSGALALVPHFSLMEAITLLPACHEGPNPEIGVVYRPFFNAAIEKWVKMTRERFGIKLLSRKSGFSEAMAIIERGGAAGVLFDQNAGHKGVLGFFFNRIVSSTPLPDLIQKRLNPALYMVYSETSGFLKATIHVEPLTPRPSESVIDAANHWLENKLKSNENLCADWLWLHNRWRTQDSPETRLRIESRKENQSLPTGYNINSIPKETRFWIRLPNWLGDVVMAIPLIQALRKSRPDAEITLLAKPQFIDLLQKLDIADQLIPLPKKGLGYFSKILKLRKGYPDTQINFTNSFRGDLEAYLIGAPQRIGIERLNKKRPLLTHTWKVPAELDEAEIHQSHLWSSFFRHFGLQELPDYETLKGVFNIEVVPNRIGLICGTENSPEKRWPIEHWKSLIHKLLKSDCISDIMLFGTANDFAITSAIAEAFSKQSVFNLAGKTSITEFAENLSKCELIICNDTGGMHLANLLGIPLIVIFGPTNPIRTGPIFNTRNNVILQPENCPKTGGFPINLISPETVFNKSKEILNKNKLTPESILN